MARRVRGGEGRGGVFEEAIKRKVGVMKCQCGNEMELQHVCENCGERKAAGDYSEHEVQMKLCWKTHKTLEEFCKTVCTGKLGWNRQRRKDCRNNNMCKFIYAKMNETQSEGTREDLGH